MDQKMKSLLQFNGLLDSARVSFHPERSQDEWWLENDQTNWEKNIILQKLLLRNKSWKGITFHWRGTCFSIREPGWELPKIYQYQNAYILHLSA